MAAPTEDTKLEILNDHYKDTFTCLQEIRQMRERLFLAILGILTLMMFQVFSPTGASDAIGDVISEQLGLQNTTIDISFIGSVLWFGMLGLGVRYFQTVIHVERQYDYLHSLEDQLSKVYNGKAFTREGKAYLKKYPWFSQWAHILYTIIFPALLIIVAGARIANEIQSASIVTPTLLFNVFAAVLLLGSTLLYLSTRYLQK